MAAWKRSSRADSRTPTRLLMLADGRRLACAEYGDPDGLPVLALHGTPGSRLMFALADAAARSRGMRLIAPERPGYGLSDCRPSASLARAATDLCRSRRRLWARPLRHHRRLRRRDPLPSPRLRPISTASVLLALACPVGPSRRSRAATPALQMAPFWRFVGWRDRGRRASVSSAACASMVFRSPDSAYRWLLARCVRRTARSWCVPR